MAAFILITIEALDNPRPAANTAFTFGQSGTGGGRRQSCIAGKPERYQLSASVAKNPAGPDIHEQWSIQLNNLDNSTLSHTKEALASEPNKWAKTSIIKYEKSWGN